MSRISSCLIYAIEPPAARLREYQVEDIPQLHGADSLGRRPVPEAPVFRRARIPDHHADPMPIGAPKGLGIIRYTRGRATAFFGGVRGVRTLLHNGRSLGGW